MRNRLTIKRDSHARCASPLVRLVTPVSFVCLLIVQAVDAHAQNPPSMAATTSQAQATPGRAERERGVALYRSGDAAGAVDVLRAAVKANARDAEAWYYLGLAHRRVGVRAEARKAFEQALRADPRSTQARVAIATLLLEEDKAREAEREARRVLSLDHVNPDAHTIVGLVRLRDDKPEEALKSAEAALLQTPDHASALLLKGRTLLYFYGKHMWAVSSKHALGPGASDEERVRWEETVDAELDPLRPELSRVAARMEQVAGPEIAAYPGWREVVESLRFYGQPPARSRVTIVTASRLQQADRAVLLSKPTPGYTEDARQKCLKGVVRLRMALAADGTVKHILPLRTLGRGLTWRSMEVARTIPFRPATKDGKPVSQWAVVEYNFNCY